MWLYQKNWSKPARTGLANLPFWFFNIFRWAPERRSPKHIIQSLRTVCLVPFPGGPTLVREQYPSARAPAAAAFVVHLLLFITAVPFFTHRTRWVRRDSVCTLVMNIIAQLQTRKCLSSAKLRSTDSVNPRSVLSRVLPRYRLYSKHCDRQYRYQVPGT